MLLPTNLTLIALFSSLITNIRDDLSASHRAELEIRFLGIEYEFIGNIRWVSKGVRDDFNPINRIDFDR